MWKCARAGYFDGIGEIQPLWRITLADAYSAAICWIVAPCGGGIGPK